MEALQVLKTNLINALSQYTTNLENVDAKELEVLVDAIKDIAECEYYCTITKAMEEKESAKSENNYYYTEYRYPDRDMDRDNGKMYYTSDGGMGGNQSKNYQERPWNLDTMRDKREGRSPVSRKTYIESKEMHMDKMAQTRELEKYMNELSMDLTELIDDASPEEKVILQKKLTALANKIV